MFGSDFHSKEKKVHLRGKNEGRETYIPLNHIHMPDPINKSTPIPQSTSEEKIEAH